jgi:hypothetical protein
MQTVHTSLRAGKMPGRLAFVGVSDSANSIWKEAVVRHRRLAMRKFLVILLLLSAAVLPPAASAQSVSRAETLKIAESFVQHRWHATARNLFHGKDASGIEVHTSDRTGGRCGPLQDCWQVDADNIGVAYKWGGLDTPESFDAGLQKGKAAGDVYTPEKRRLDGAGVSDASVGIDCSGFICRCWKLSKRYSTNSLGQVCLKLSSPAVLEPGDIMNHSGGHVVLFVKWLDADRKRALFYESAPFSKTLASERELSDLTAAGYVPLRYRNIH